jgi:hypothetical protein
MGGGFSWKFNLPGGGSFRATGKVVGQSEKKSDEVLVDVKGNKILSDGIYSVQSTKGESVKAVINTGSSVEEPGSRTTDTTADVEKAAEEARSAFNKILEDLNKVNPAVSESALESAKPFSSAKNNYVESLSAEITDKENYVSRLKVALDEWNETGVWKGEDYGVSVNPDAKPGNITRDQLSEKNYNPDDFAGAAQERINELDAELGGLEKSLARISRQPETTTPIEAILADPETLARISARADEIRAIPRAERSELFRDGEYQYVVHWGADTLDGGALDPARSEGDETSESVVANTRKVNRVTATKLVARRDYEKQNLSDLTKIQQELKDTGLMNLSAAENPFGVHRLIGLLTAKGKDRNPNTGGERAYRPFPDADDLKEMGIDELTPEMKETISDAVERSRNTADMNVTRLDKVADKLIEDDYQYSSSYPADKLQTANGYGGRYGQEGDSWKDDAFKADRAGVHVFRVRIGEDATKDTGGPDEIHLIGKHEPIASLSIETHRNLGKQPTSAQTTWQGWLAEVIESDKNSRATNAPE